MPSFREVEVKVIGLLYKKLQDMQIAIELASYPKVFLWFIKWLFGDIK